jgi:hypothetical protein
MSVQDPLLHLGYLTLSTLYDARRSSITGTTLLGPNGSAQFYPVYMSTVSDLVVTISTSTSAPITPSTLTGFIGILQNTPGPGQAADIGIFGVSKMLAGSTTILKGNLIQPSSVVGGEMVLYAQGNGMPVGFALESPTTAGQVFAAALFGYGHGGFST